MPLPVRKRAAGNMAGAIFMCNITSRDQCMEAGVFGLPMVYYEHLVSHVKQGMRLFLFEKDLRKLYGVYEAASDGGLHIKKDGFHHAFPAQVRICIVRNCRPLSEEEFAPAIRDNYYLKETFYFDLSYDQVVRLCKLFGCQNYMEHRSSGTQDCSKPDMEGGSSDDDESSFMFPQTQALANRYSSHTSMPTGLPPGVEVPLNMMMPFGMENFGVPINFMHNQWAGSLSYPHYHYVTPNLIYGAVSTNSTPCTFPIPALSLENPQGNADYQERTLCAHDEMYASEQVTNNSFSHFELDSELDCEAEAGESTDLDPPFLDFKRRSDAGNVDKTLGKEISGRGKRRRLVRPSFEENNASSAPVPEIRNFSFVVDISDELGSITDDSKLLDIFEEVLQALGRITLVGGHHTQM